MELLDWIIFIFNFLKKMNELENKELYFLVSFISIN